MFNVGKTTYFCLFLLLTVFPLQANAGMKECHWQLDEKFGTATPETRMLEPMEFSYDFTFDEDCTMVAVAVLNRVLDCRRPRIALDKSETPGRIKAHVTTKCMYRVPGNFYLPPIHFEFKSADKQLSITHPPLQHIVVANEDHYPNIKEDLKGMLVLLPWQEQVKWPFVIGFIFLAGIVTGVCIYLKRRPEEEVPEKVPFFKSPIEIFRSDMALLKTQSPVSIEDYKQFHDTLSQSVKKYIAQRLKLNVMSCTAAQIVHRLKEYGIPETTCKDLQSLLKESAKVRFAHYEPRYSENVSLLNEMTSAIEKIETFVINRVPDPPKDTEDSPISSVEEMTIQKSPIIQKLTEGEEEWQSPEPDIQPKQSASDQAEAPESHSISKVNRPISNSKSRNLVSAVVTKVKSGLIELKTFADTNDNSSPEDVKNNEGQSGTFPKQNDRDKSGTFPKQNDRDKSGTFPKQNDRDKSGTFPKQNDKNKLKSNENLMKR